MTTAGRRKQQRGCCPKMRSCRSPRRPNPSPARDRRARRPHATRAYLPRPSHRRSRYMPALDAGAVPPSMALDPTPSDPRLDNQRVPEANRSRAAAERRASISWPSQDRCIRASVPSPFGLLDWLFHAKSPKPPLPPILNRRLFGGMPQRNSVPRVDLHSLAVTSRKPSTLRTASMGLPDSSRQISHRAIAARRGSRNIRALQSSAAHESLLITARSRRLLKAVTCARGRRRTSSTAPSSSPN